MSFENLPGIRLFLATLAMPVTQFIVSLSVVSMPYIVVKIAVMMSLADYLLMSSLQSFRSTDTSDDTYDFIVVGGGSAGAAVAGRLSQNHRVLLIEAGGDPHPLTYFPVAAGVLLNQPMIDWQYQTEPLENCGFASIDGKSTWPRGKSLGGCSTANFMIYMRGNPQDFNRWASHAGDERWKYENVEKIFKRMEDYHGFWEDTKYHGVGGPMHIEKINFGRSADYWLEAGRELGMTITDPNAYQIEGFFPLDVTTKRGLRFSTFRGYIWPNRFNRNLVVHKYSHATKIHFDDELRAIGVTYYRHGIKRYAKAKKEIIISAGSINTPKLLMLSGIGPKDHLSSVGVQTLIDLPVGKNLSDHVTVYLGPFLLNKEVSLLFSRDFNAVAVLKSFLSGKGVLSSPDGTEATGLIASSKSSADWPDILLVLQAIGVHKTLGHDMALQLGMKREYFETFLNYNANNDSNFVAISVGLPKSRGYIRLRDSNPFSSPIIDPKYFSDENGEDMEVMLQGVEFVVNLFENTTTYKKLGARFAPNPFPGCENFVMKSRPYWECFVRSVTTTIFHPSGTCSMGKVTDPDSVVDSELRVIGTKGLRVADASIMPFITNANLNGPSIMIVSNFIHHPTLKTEYEKTAKLFFVRILRKWI